MTWSEKKIRKQLYFMLIISIVLFFSAQLINFYLEKRNNIQQVTKRLDKKVKIAEAELSDELVKISSHLKNDKEDDFRDFLIKNYKNYFSRHGVEILIYRNDSLTFWTDQVCAVPSVKNTIFFNTGIYESGSGNYLILKKQERNYDIIGLQLLNYNFKYENEYLPKGFHKRFRVPDNTQLYLEKKQNNVTDTKGNFLFSVDFANEMQLSAWLMYLLFSIYVTSLLCFTAAIYYALLIVKLKLHISWIIVAISFGTIVFLLRLLQLKFPFPYFLYHLSIFNPVYFATSQLMPSLGDLAINALLLLQFSSIVYRYPPTYIGLVSRNKIIKHVMAIVIISVVITMFYFLTDTITNLVINSNISFRFEDLLSLPHLSYFSIFIIAVILITIYFLTELLILFFTKYRTPGLFILYGLLAVAGYTVYLYYFAEFDVFYVLFLVIFLLIFYLQLLFRTENIFGLNRIIGSLILLTTVATYILNKTEDKREQQRRVIYAGHLVENHSYLAEYYYENIVKEMQRDQEIKNKLNEVKDRADFSTLASYIKEKYFTAYWTKYNIQITVCSPAQILNIQPQNVTIGCNKYFESIIVSLSPTNVKGLYINKNLINETYYLGKLSLYPQDKKTVDVYFEISYKEVSKGLGYPELLIDRKKKGAEDNLSAYSYAFYNHGDLIKKVGIYPYNIKETKQLADSIPYGFYHENKYSHLIYKTDSNTYLILSHKNVNIADWLSPFSYIFIFIVCIIFTLQVFTYTGIRPKWGFSSFKVRFQLFLVVTSIAISLLLVIVSLLFINNISFNKNNEIIKEKMNSVLFDIESLYRDFNTFEEVYKSGDLSNRLIALSNTFFIDVNIYNPNGYLIASSNDRIFKEGLLSLQIHPVSDKLLKNNKKSFFIVRESIGKYTYLSAYTAIRNRDNKVIGYLNLPYFARQEEIKHEISRLISAFVNIYIFMILSIIGLSLILAQYFTKPLQHIGKQFREIRIGNKNEKIHWKRKDEIGRLVEEFNHMIDELSHSADLLARSEREGAWRQMARQVAHEIKNPLTPIKLNVQMLMRAWNDKDPHWEERLKKFSNNLILQIDTLSSIASEFSDFAQMPEPQMQTFDIVPMINESVEFYKDSSYNTDIQFVTSLNSCVVYADPNQMLRVFNNLIKNALQAISYGEKGEIVLELIKRERTCLFSIKDNGMGIPKEKYDKIFSPNFTTKTTGMGLGLAMVKNIIQSIGGEIWFESSNSGTIFYISIPSQYP